MLDAAVDQKTLSAEFRHTYGRPTAQVGQTATWGGPASGTQAELKAMTASTARLAIYSNKIEPALARRMHQLSPSDVTREVAAAF
jgi:hypothetical protein